MADDPLAQLNKAKELSWEHAADAVAFLVGVMEDVEADWSERAFAAAELLQFAMKAPG